MSGGSGGGQTTSQSGVAPEFQPLAGQGLLGALGLLFPNGGTTPASMPPGQNYSVAPFSPYQNQALSDIGGVTPLAGALGGAGAGMLGDTLSGKYLNPATNPYLTATFNEASKGLTDQYQLATAPSLMAEGQQAAGGGPGALQGSGFQQQQWENQYGLGQNIQNLGTNIFGGNYQQERQNQLGALGQLGATQGALYAPAQQLFNAGANQQGQQQNVLNTGTQNAIRQGQYPWSLLGQFGGLFSQLAGGSSSTVQSGGK